MRHAHNLVACSSALLFGRRAKRAVGPTECLPLAGCTAARIMMPAEEMGGICERRVSGPSWRVPPWRRWGSSRHGRRLRTRTTCASPASHHRSPAGLQDSPPPHQDRRGPTRTRRRFSGLTLLPPVPMPAISLSSHEPCRPSYGLRSPYQPLCASTRHLLSPSRTVSCALRAALRAEPQPELLRSTRQAR